MFADLPRDYDRDLSPPSSPSVIVEEWEDSVDENSDYCESENISDGEEDDLSIDNGAEGDRLPSIAEILYPNGGVPNINDVINDLLNHGPINNDDNDRRPIDDDVVNNPEDNEVEEILRGLVEQEAVANAAPAVLSDTGDSGFESEGADDGAPLTDESSYENEPGEEDEEEEARSDHIDFLYEISINDFIGGENGLHFQIYQDEGEQSSTSGSEEEEEEEEEGSEGALMQIDSDADTIVLFDDVAGDPDYEPLEGAEEEEVVLAEAVVNLGADRALFDIKEEESTIHHEMTQRRIYYRDLRQLVQHCKDAEMNLYRRRLRRLRERRQEVQRDHPRLRLQPYADAPRRYRDFCYGCAKRFWCQRIRRWRRCDSCGFWLCPDCAALPDHCDRETLI